MTPTALDRAVRQLGAHLTECPICRRSDRRCPEALHLLAVVRAAAQRGVMSVPTCEYPGCDTSLRQSQGRFCSMAHFYAIKCLPTYVCESCHQAYQPNRRKRRYCSVACVPPPSPPQHPPIMLTRLLELLDVTPGYWMSSSDLAIYLYGDDTYRDQQAVRMLLHRLRQTHTIESRPASWARTSSSPARAYRLAQTPTSQEVAA